MRGPILSLAALLLAGTALGQSVMMPIPKYTSTYSYSGAARGFYFQSPVNFTVVGLRVPDEKKFGKQNVALYGLAAKPSGYTPTASDLLFYSAGQPSSAIIPCNVNIKAGQWFCVLGMCGDATTSHNSYGNGGFKSSISGGPAVTLTRLTFSGNLVTTKGIGRLSAASSGSVGRVEVYVKRQDFAMAKDYGAGTTQTPITGKGQLPLRYTSLDELDGLLHRLRG